MTIAAYNDGNPFAIKFDGPKHRASCVLVAAYEQLSQIIAIGG